MEIFDLVVDFSDVVLAGFVVLIAPFDHLRLHYEKLLGYHLIITTHLASA